MRLARGADVVGSRPVAWPATASCAISGLIDPRSEVLAGQRVSRMATRSTLARYLLGGQLLPYLVPELLSECELARMLLRARPELEGIPDAHIPVSYTHLTLPTIYSV